MNFLTILNGNVTGVYSTREEAESQIPTIVATPNEWNQCPYCGAWFFGRKKRFCTAVCRVKWWRVVERDGRKSIDPYGMTRGENRREK